MQGVMSDCHSVFMYDCMIFYSFYILSHAYAYSLLDSLMYDVRCTSIWYIVHGRKERRMNEVNAREYRYSMSV